MFWPLRGIGAGDRLRPYRFVCEDNGEIDQVKETRNWEPCNRWEYHYDLRPTINGVKVYVETRLHPESFSSREELKFISSTSSLPNTRR